MDDVVMRKIADMEHTHEVTGADVLHLLRFDGRRCQVPAIRYAGLRSSQLNCEKSIRARFPSRKS